MLQSKLFTKTNKENPKDETALNAKLLLKGGFVYKNSAGIYSFLPLGLLVIRKLSQIIKQEIDAIGGQEILMSSLHDKHYLMASGRWNVDVIYKAVVAGEKEPSFNLSWTNEEMVAEIAKKYINSYKDLPFSAYQIQTKFRYEPRAKSGLLRGREFLMKDLYSFHSSIDDFNAYYKKVAIAYNKIFKACGLKAIYTLAGGGDFTGGNTHEFQVVSPAGEDIIYFCKKCNVAENKEISKLKNGEKCLTCKGLIEEKSSIEVGNIFPLGDKYSKVFNLYFVDKNGEKKYVQMGSYGIGISRLMATIVEIYNDQKGIIWPKTVSPFLVHLIGIEDNLSVKKKVIEVYDNLKKHKIDVLYDDRLGKSAGEKFSDADLIGIPYRVVVSERTIKKGGVELKQRGKTKEDLVKFKDLINLKTFK